MNSKQKTTLIIGAVLILGVLIFWYATGAKIWTATQVPVEVEDELFGFKRTEWKDKFVLGLEYTAVFIAAVAGICAVLWFRFKNKNEKVE